MATVTLQIYQDSTYLHAQILNQTVDYSIFGYNYYNANDGFIGNRTIIQIQKVNTNYDLWMFALTNYETTNGLLVPFFISYKGTGIQLIGNTTFSTPNYFITNNYTEISGNSAAPTLINFDTDLLLNSAPATIPITNSTNITIGVAYGEEGNSIPAGGTESFNYQAGETIYLGGSAPTYSVTIENANNLDHVEFGDPGLVVNEFPYTRNVTSNQTWYFTGSPDKTVTINYNNTSIPVITDT